jgi:hypothetical protein
LGKNDRRPLRLVSRQPLPGRKSTAGVVPTRSSKKVHALVNNRRVICDAHVISDQRIILVKPLISLIFVDDLAIRDNSGIIERTSS